MVPRHGHDLRRVENEAHIVKGRGDEAARGDVALGVLIGEGVFEGQVREEGSR